MHIETAYREAESNAKPSLLIRGRLVIMAMKPDGYSQVNLDSHRPHPPRP